MEIVAVDSSVLSALVRRSPGSSRDASSLARVIDALGVGSAAAQRLPGPITSAQRLAADPSQRIYIARDGARALGFIKVGPRVLFLTVGALGVGLRLPDPEVFVGRGSVGGAVGSGAVPGRVSGGAGGSSTRTVRPGALWETRALCVLDFFVEASSQRRGIGLALFQEMLANERVVHPCALAYDRPSAMFRSFLRRHWRLDAAEVQANNFAFFDAYYEHLRSGALAVGAPWGGEPLQVSQGHGRSASGASDLGDAEPLSMEQQPSQSFAADDEAGRREQWGGGGEHSTDAGGGASLSSSVALEASHVQQRALIEAHREAQRRIAAETWRRSGDAGVAASVHPQQQRFAVHSPPSWVARVASPRDTAELEDGGSTIAAAARARRVAGRPDGDPWLEPSVPPTTGGVRHALRMRRD